MYNHSAEPNCYNKRVGDQRFLVTIRPIKAGEELTGDYRLQPDLEQPQPGWIEESLLLGWKEWVTIPSLGRFVAKLDTGNGTKASSLGVDQWKIDGDQVAWSCNGQDRVDPIKSWSHAEVGDTIDKRPVIILDIELGPHRLSGVPVALADRSGKETPFLINRDILSKLGVSVASDKEFIAESDQFWTGYERLVDLGMIDLEDWDKIKDDVVLLVKERLAGHYPDLDVEKLAFDEIRIHQPGKGRRDPYYSVYIDKGVNHSYKLWSCRLIVGFQQAPGRSDSKQLIQVPDHFWTRPIGGYADIPDTVAQSKWIADEIIAWMDRVFVPWIGVEVPETP
jgi:hypothetical protein